MKNILTTIFILMMFSKTCFSQDDKNKVNYGFKLGLCYSDFGSYYITNTNLMFHDVDDAAKLGLEVGGAINMKLFKHLSLQTEVLYRAKGGGIKWVNDSVYYSYSDGTTSLAFDEDLYICRYIDIPITLGFRIIKFNNDLHSAIQLKTGFENSFLISSSLKSTRYHVVNEDPVEKVDRKSFPYAKKYLNGYIVGIAYSTDIYSLDFLIIHDLKNAYSIKQFGDGVEMETNITTISLSFGLWL